MKNFNGQAGQDKFVTLCLKSKRNGKFLEIGAGPAISGNNTFLLEKDFDWNGIMVDFQGNYWKEYQLYRTKSHAILGDALKIDYKAALEAQNMPKDMDYLQIDLEVRNRSTLDCLELLDRTVFDTYKFAVVTFEHDIYVGNQYDTREKSRSIFAKRGQHRVFSDIKHKTSPDITFEDWQVHPDLVDMEQIQKVTTNTTLVFTDALKIMEDNSKM